MNEKKTSEWLQVKGQEKRLANGTVMRKWKKVKWKAESGSHMTSHAKCSKGLILCLPMLKTERWSPAALHFSWGSHFIAKLSTSAYIYIYIHTLQESSRNSKFIHTGHSKVMSNPVVPGNFVWGFYCFQALEAFFSIYWFIFYIYIYINIYICFHVLGVVVLQIDVTCPNIHLTNLSLDKVFTWWTFHRSKYSLDQPFHLTHWKFDNPFTWEPFHLIFFHLNHSWSVLFSLDLSTCTHIGPVHL